MLVQYLTATPEYKHHTYSISVADGANAFLSIFEVASSLGLKVSTSVATQGGIKFVSRCSVESPHTNKDVAFCNVRRRMDCPYRSRD